MKKLKFTVLSLCLAMMFSCGNNTGNGALIGTGSGAVLGGIVGNIIGKNTKGTAIGAAVGAAVGAGAGALIGKHMDNVKAKAAAELENAKVEEVVDANGLKAVKVTFDAGILFQTGDATLSNASKTELASFAKVLKDDGMCSVDIQGYTDNVGWKNSTAEQSQQKNITLSQKRADSVKDYLSAQGVNASQLKNIQGLGESNPVASNDTEAGRKLNRRVEVYLYASEKMIEDANNGQLK